MHPINSVVQVVNEEEIRQAQDAVANVYVDRLLKEYIVALVGATRWHESVFLGASTRASIGLLTLAQSRALLDGRDFAVPDDVKAVASGVLGHRMVLTADGRSNHTEDETINQILESVPVTGTGPVEGLPFPKVGKGGE